jgi:hypothetical protein
LYLKGILSMRRFVGSTGTLLITVYASIYAMPSLAQNAVSTGTISGSVHDASGAVLPNVAVTLTGNATGIKLSAKSNADGLFIFPALQVGSYSASFSVAGFKATEIDSLQVGVGHTTEAQAVLQIGDVSQQVVVQASDSGVDPSDTTVGTLITKSTIDGLPLSGRRYTDFVLLTPNVTADGQFGHISFAGQSGGDLSGYNNTSGGASNANGSTAFTVDGSDATSYYYGDNRGFTRIPYIFGLNAIQEFQVQPNVYNAAYGGAGAGFINTVTKSGTNALHGDLFYYNRNSGTGANDAVDKAAGNPKLQNTLQQFGFFTSTMSSNAIATRSTLSTRGSPLSTKPVLACPLVRSCRRPTPTSRLRQTSRRTRPPRTLSIRRIFKVFQMRCTRLSPTWARERVAAMILSSSRKSTGRSVRKTR